jgi:hypothetical protein
MKNSTDTIGNGTRDLPACSTVLQPTAPPRKLDSSEVKYELLKSDPLIIIIHNICIVNVFSDQPSKHSRTRTQSVFNRQPQYNSRETFIAYEASHRREFMLRISPSG